VAAFFIVARLWPGKRASVPMAGVTDDRFALVLERTSAPQGTERVRELLGAHGAVVVFERVGEVAA
jgi:hypothetical protein